MGKKNLTVNNAVKQKNSFYFTFFAVNISYVSFQKPSFDLKAHLHIYIHFLSCTSFLSTYRALSFHYKYHELLSQPSNDGT